MCHKLKYSPFRAAVVSGGIFVFTRADKYTLRKVVKLVNRFFYEALRKYFKTVHDHLGD